MPKILNNTFTCRDIDECISNPCGANSQCTNRQGSYQCVCDGGYMPKILNNTFTCRDQGDIVAESNCEKIPAECLVDILIDEIHSKEGISETFVPAVLDRVPELLNNISSDASVTTKKKIDYVNSVLQGMEHLLSDVTSANVADVKYYTVNTTLSELQVMIVGPDAKAQLPSVSLQTTCAQLDIDLYGLAKSTGKRQQTSAAILVLKHMEDTIGADYFITRSRRGSTGSDLKTTMMSKVISVSLTPNISLIDPASLTLRHSHEADPLGQMSCVYWNGSAWLVDGCDVTHTNSTHTVCTCEHFSTFSLIMQTERPPERELSLLYVIAESVGIVFLTLTLLTFALCARDLDIGPEVTNVARLNLSISLLLAHLQLLLVQQYIDLIHPQKWLCRVLSGLQNFLLWSGFLWVKMDILLLFISIKALQKTLRAGPSTGHLCVIGYLLPLVLIGDAVVLVPDGYGTEWCGVRTYRGLSWILLGPAYFIFLVSLIILVMVVISLCLVPASKNSIRNKISIQAVRVFSQFVVISCPWVVGSFWAGGSSGLLDIFFLILSSQQGTFLFLIHCLTNPQVLCLWRRQCQNLFALSPKPLHNM
ncbi:adhesion G protein-coupled receptor E2-like [Engraulis encrasicolus]|uniref:adhesion G protein-coupled receptor E2-like n=1 Tax=Engraulis encrasicolus TaxID=184585 RepID=UPI002FCF6A3F